MAVISLRNWHLPIETMQSKDLLFHHGVARRRPGRNFHSGTRLFLSWISPDPETAPGIGLSRFRSSRVTGPNRRPRALRTLIGALTLGLGLPSAALAADYTVNNGDGGSGATANSLPWAMAQTDVTGVLFTSGLGTITLSGTQTPGQSLSLGRVSGATDSLTITGSTVANPLFSVNTGSGLSLASSLALTGAGGVTGSGSGSGTGGTGGTGGSGGVAVSGGSGFTLTNSGTISGGSGGSGGPGGSVVAGIGGTGGTGGSGGVAVSGGSGFTLTNNGTIEGGNGGSGGRGGDATAYDNATGGTGGRGGNGGVAVSGSGFTLTNTGGTIEGGGGGSGGSGGSASVSHGPSGGSGGSGSGGVAIVSTGNATITNSGTIEGGLAYGSATNRADAIDLSGGGNTLSLRAGSTILGAVVSTSGSTNGGDTLSLGGNSASTFDASLIGSQYKGFANYTKTGTSTWTLTGTATAATPWTISAGTLAISQDASLGATSGGLTLDGGGLETTASITSTRAITLGGGGGTIAADSGTTYTVSGVISGGGGLTVGGGGTLALSGTNTYSGATTIASGATLTLASASSLSSASAITDNGTFDISALTSGATLASLSGSGGVTLGANSLTLANGGSFGGAISGSGGVTLAGGTLALSGANTYSGATTIASGATLAAGNASLAGDLVNRGTVTLDGAPPSYPTLRVSGDYSQAGTATLVIGAASASQYGHLVVNGTAALAGALSIDVSGTNFTPGSSLSDIITANSLSGTFASVTDNSALFNFSALYSATSVSLGVTTSSLSAEQAVTAFGNPRARGGAGVLDRAFAADTTGPLARLFTSLTTARQVSEAVSQTLPALGGDGVHATQSALSSVNGVIAQRLQPGPAGPAGVAGGDAGDDSAVWIRSFTNWNSQDARGEGTGFSADTSGFVAGVETETGPDSRAGLAFAYGVGTSRGKTTTLQRQETSLYELTGYGSHPLPADTTATYHAGLGLTQNRETRGIDLGGAGRAAADFNGVFATLGASVEHSFALGDRDAIVPYVKADYSWMRNDGYREGTASASLDPLLLTVRAQQSNSLIPELGVRGEHRFAPAWSVAGHVGEGYETLDRRTTLAASYAAAPGETFITPGTEIGAWRTRAGLDLTYRRDEMSVTAGYTLEAGDGSLGQTLSAEAKLAF